MIRRSGLAVRCRDRGTEWGGEDHDRGNVPARDARHQAVCECGYDRARTLRVQARKRGDRGGQAEPATPRGAGEQRSELRIRVDAVRKVVRGTDSAVEECGLQIPALLLLVAGR